MNIAIGNILEWLDPEFPDEDRAPSSEETISRERVLWGDADVIVSIPMSRPHKGAGDGMPVVHLRSKLERALEENRLCINRDFDPYGRLLILPSEYKEKHAEHQKKAWNAIQDIAKKEPGIYDPGTRGRLVRQAAHKHKVSRPYIYKQLRRYWVAGNILEALLPDFFHCGHIPQGQEFKHSKNSLETKIKIVKGIKKFGGGGKTGQNLNDDICEEYFSEKDVLTERRLIYPTAPSVHVTNYYRKLLRDHDLKWYIINQFGINKFKKLFRPLLKTSQTYVSGPADTFQIDHTVADIYLVNKDDRLLIIGRPMVYIVIDVFSRLITGIFVGLEGPSWEGGASRALLNAFSPKLPFLQELGMDELFWDVLGERLDESTWPADCIPARVLGDFEIVSQKADAPIMPLGITFSNTPSRQPWAKGIVEAQFRVSKDYFLDWAPGAVDEWRKEVEGRDYKYDAIFTLEEFTKILLLYVLLWNDHLLPKYKLDKAMIRDHVQPRPKELWRWGWANLCGLPNQRSREVLELALLPRKTGRVTQFGLEFGKKTYVPQCEDAEEILLRASYFNPYEVEVSYDSRSAECVLMHDPEKRRVVRCLLNLPKERSCVGVNEEETRVLDAAKSKLINAAAAGERQSRVDKRQVGRRITEEAMAAHEKARILGPDTTKRRRGDVAKNRADEVRTRASEKHGEQGEQQARPDIPDAKDEDKKSGDAGIFDLMYGKGADHEEPRKH